MHRSEAGAWQWRETCEYIAGPRMRGSGGRGQSQTISKVSREGSQKERDCGAQPPATVLRALSSGLFGDRHVLQCHFIQSTVKQRLNSGKLSPSLLSRAKLPTRPERLSRDPPAHGPCTLAPAVQVGLSDTSTAQPEGSCGSRGGARGRREREEDGEKEKREKALLSKTRGFPGFSAG